MSSMTSAPMGVGLEIDAAVEVRTFASGTRTEFVVPATSCIVSACATVATGAPCIAPNKPALSNNWGGWINDPSAPDS